MESFLNSCLNYTESNSWASSPTQEQFSSVDLSTDSLICESPTSKLFPEPSCCSSTGRPGSPLFHLIEANKINWSDLGDLSTKDFSDDSSSSRDGLHSEEQLWLTSGEETSTFWNKPYFGSQNCDLKSSWGSSSFDRFGSFGKCIRNIQD